MASVIGMSTRIRMAVWVRALRLRGALPTLLLLFAYASVEQSTMLWASSYMVHAGHMSIHYAGIYANLFFIGLTLGSVIAGCLALRLSDGALLGGGLGVLVAALVVMIAPMGPWRALVAPVMLGFGCAPINPAVVHMTPRLFGAVHTMTMIGWETAVIAVATLVSPAHCSPCSLPRWAWRPCRGIWRVSRRLAYWPPSFS